MIWLRIAFLAAVYAVGWFAQNHAYQRGWDTREAQAQVERSKIMQEAADIAAKNILDAKKINDQVVQDLQRVNTQQVARAKTLSARLQAQEAIPYTPQETPNGFIQPPLLAQSVLDDGTVRLLNDARAGADVSDPVSAPSGADEAVGAPAATAPYVTGRELAENDLEVVRLYHVLATRHDALVDWVTQQCTASAPGP